VIIVVMGASGAGKTTVGRALASALAWRFIEGDHLHPPENIAKMRAGTALTDCDRMPWLEAVHTAMEHADASGESVVVACSALTHEYRAFLSQGLDSVRFVYLRAGAELLAERLRTRRGHFAGPALLPSQLSTLEPPPPTALTLDAGWSVERLVAAIRREWNL
jgi:gluconokinase